MPGKSLYQKMHETGWRLINNKWWNPKEIKDVKQWQVVNFIGEVVAQFKGYKAAMHFVMKQRTDDYKIVQNREHD